MRHAQVRRVTTAHVCKVPAKLCKSGEIYQGLCFTCNSFPRSNVARPRVFCSTRPPPICVNGVLFCPRVSSRKQQVYKTKHFFPDATPKHTLTTMSCQLQRNGIAQRAYEAVGVAIPGFVQATGCLSDKSWRFYQTRGGDPRDTTEDLRRDTQKQ